MLFVLTLRMERKNEFRLWRYRDKNGVEDLKKAKWYLKKLIVLKEHD